jgi:hypothetical protein
LQQIGQRGDQKSSETLMVVAKGESSQKRFPRRCPKKGVMPILRYIYPYDQILPRMPYLLPLLTKFLQPVTIDLIHLKPPAQGYFLKRTLQLLTGGFFLG